MTNSLFVKQVLDQIYPQLQPQAGLDKFIGHQLVGLSENYAQAAVTPSINFSDPRVRFAYIYQYVGAHARYLARILRMADVALGNNSLLTMPNPKVACLGGGPGTDALGVLKYLREFHPNDIPAHVECCVMDKEASWNQNWGLIAQLAGLPITPFFNQLDATQPMAAGPEAFIASADLITMSYLISEVQKLNSNGCVEKFVRSVFTSAKNGAVLVYVDNSGSHTAFFDAIAGTTGWNSLASWDWTPEEKQWGSFGEEVKHLDGYAAKFKRTYKIAARLSYRIFQKPLL